MKFSFTKAGIIFCTIFVLAINSSVISGQDQAEAEDDGCKENQIYEEETEACAGIHLTQGNATNCQLRNATEICVLNAVCHPGYWPWASTLMEGYCACSPDYVPDANGTCIRPELTAHYGDFCDNKVAFCSQAQNLRCDLGDFRCVCNWANDTYDPSIQQCRSPIGGVCNERPTEEGFHRYCYAKNTKCYIFHNDLPYGLCKCEEGFCPDESGECTPCTETEEPKPTTESTPTAATCSETRPTVPHNEDDEEGSTTGSSAGNNIVTTILPHSILQLLIFCVLRF